MKKLFVVSTVTLFFFSLAAPGFSIELAASCGNCHVQIFEEWQQSGHAQASAAKNPLYQAMFDWAMKESNGALEGTCQSCHEPARFHPQPSTHSQQAIAEGVTCDICHALYPNKNGLLPLRPAPDNIKLGANADAISSSHKVKVAKDLSKSTQCLQCHDRFVSQQNNLEICNTGPEWQTSPFRKLKVECQDCHMVSHSGKSAELGKLREEIQSHGFPGNSNEFMRVAVTFNLDVKEHPDSLLITVRIVNRGAGHSIPTGTPMRSMILTVTALDAEDLTVWRNWRFDPVAEDRQAVFARFLVDERGVGPVPPWQAEKVLFDQRIASKQEKIITYRIPRRNVKTITGSLEYQAAPLSLLRRLGVTDTKYTQPKQVAAVTKMIAR